LLDSKGENVKKTIVDNWNFIMNHNKNPLKNIPDTNTRHMIMQILAWMWCIVFSMYFSSMWIFGITTIAHIFILGAIAITVATFETAKRKPSIFGGYYTPSRSRAIYYEGKRIELDPNDKGGEHE
jgi:hypothetical protein|tara:strand:- start:73 stop:447 length:375 start_codon:yes stop_codon:yes gene_type:complete